MPWYITAVRNCQLVGHHLAEFLDYLDSRGVALSNVHVVGFSLGAEVAGYTGQRLRAGKDPRLPRITGEPVTNLGAGGGGRNLYRANQCAQKGL
jgi:hypothetical protein